MELSNQSNRSSSSRALRHWIQGLPGAVWAFAGGVILLLLAVSARYGFHRDELYFVVAGRRLAWGYVDQPPLTPAVAKIADLLPGAVSPTALRLVPAVSAGLVVVLAAVLARRFGGGIAVAAASGFAAVGGFYLAVGHLLSTATFDVMLWAAVIVLVAALVDGVDPRWWLGVGLLVGVGMLNKHTIAALVVALIFGLVLT